MCCTFALKILLCRCRIEAILTHLQQLNPNTQIALMATLPWGLVNMPRVYVWPNEYTAGIAIVSELAQAFAGNQTDVHYMDCGGVRYLCRNRSPLFCICRIEAIVTYLQQLNPDTQIVLMAILPWGLVDVQGVYVWPNEYTPGIGIVNELIQAFAANKTNVHYVDCGHVLYPTGQVGHCANKVYYYHMLYAKPKQHSLCGLWACTVPYRTGQNLCKRSILLCNIVACCMQSQTNMYCMDCMHVLYPAGQVEKLCKHSVILLHAVCKARSMCTMWTVGMFYTPLDRLAAVQIQCTTVACCMQSQSNAHYVDCGHVLYSTGQVRSSANTAYHCCTL